MPIDPTEEFLKHAAECKRMARYAHGSEDKAAWARLAERWQRCAEWFKGETLAITRHSTTHHRRTIHNWAHH